MITKTDAIHALCPTAGFTINGGKIVQWDSTDPQPTEQEIEEKIAELKYQEEVNEYQEKRKLEYPDWEDQLDKIYHSGVNAWKADIKKIKDKYPKQTMDATELQKRKDAVIFNLQKRDYEKAIARLGQYELSAGVKDENENYTIEPLPLWVDNERNPLVVQDETERAEAREVINNTPQAVIDSINT